MMGAVLLAALKKHGVAQYIDPGTGTPSPVSLNQLQMLSTSYSSTDALGSTIGTLSGFTSGATVTYTVSTPNAVTVSGSLVKKGSGSPVPGAGAFQTFTLTITETLAGAVNSPRSTQFTLTVSTPAASTGTNLTIEAVGAKTRSGVKVAKLATGASISGTNSAHFNVAADGTVTVSDTGQDALAGSYSFTVTGDAAVTTLNIPVEAGNVFDANNAAEIVAAINYCIPTSRTTDWIISPRAGTDIDGGGTANNTRGLNNTSIPGKDGSMRGQVSSPNLIVTNLTSPAYNATTGVVSGIFGTPLQVVKVFVDGVQYPRADMVRADGTWSFTLSPKSSGSAVITAKAYDRVPFASRNLTAKSTISGGSITIRARVRDTVTVSTSWQFNGIGPLAFENLKFTRVSQNPVQDTWIDNPNYPGPGQSPTIAQSGFNTFQAEPAMVSVFSSRNIAGVADYFPQVMFTSCTFSCNTTNVDAYQQCIRNAGDVLVVQDCKFDRFWRAIAQDTNNFIELKRNEFKNFTNDILDAYQSAGYGGQVGKRLLLVVLNETVHSLTESVTQSNNHSDWLQLGALNPLFFVTSSGTQASPNTTPNIVYVKDKNGNITATQITSASSNSSQAWMAFDQTDTGNVIAYHGGGANEWRASTTGPQWLRWEKDVGYATAGIYHIRASMTDAALSAPKAWTLEGSNDATTWNVIDTQTNQTGWANGETRFFFPPSPPVVPTLVAYRYLRLNISAVNDAATPVCINAWQQGTTFATNQIIDFLVADNLCVMAGDVKLQATQPGEHDHSLLPIVGHYENNFVVGNTANLIRCFYSGPGDKGLLIKNNTIIQTRPTFYGTQPAPYNTFGAGGNNNPGGVVISRTGDDITIQNNIMGFIWENYGSIFTSEPTSPRTVPRFGGAYTAVGNIYSQCYKANTGDGLSYPEIFTNLDNVLTYKSPDSADLARDAAAKIGWQWWQLMPRTDPATIRTWLTRNFTTKGSALGKGWQP